MVKMNLMLKKESSILCKFNILLSLFMGNETVIKYRD